MIKQVATVASTTDNNQNQIYNSAAESNQVKHLDLSYQKKIKNSEVLQDNQHQVKLQNMVSSGRKNSYKPAEIEGSQSPSIGCKKLINLSLMQSTDSSSKEPRHYHSHVSSPSKKMIHIVTENEIKQSPLKDQNNSNKMPLVSERFNVRNIVTSNLQKHITTEEPESSRSSKQRVDNETQEQLARIKGILIDKRQSMIIDFSSQNYNRHGDGSQMSSKSPRGMSKLTNKDEKFSNRSPKSSRKLGQPKISIIENDTGKSSRAALNGDGTSRNFPQMARATNQNKLVTTESQETFGNSREQLHQHILHQVNINQTMQNDSQDNSMIQEAGGFPARDSYQNRSKLSRQQMSRCRDKKKKRSVANVQMIPQFSSMANGLNYDQQQHQSVIANNKMPSREKCQSAERHAGLNHMKRRQRRGKRDSGAIQSSNTAAMTNELTRQDSQKEQESRPPTQLMIAQKYRAGFQSSGKNVRKLNSQKQQQTLGQEVVRAARQNYESRSLAAAQYVNYNISGIVPNIEQHKMVNVRQEASAPQKQQNNMQRFLQNSDSKINGTLDYMHAQQTQSAWRPKQLKSPFQSNTPNSVSNKAMVPHVMNPGVASSSKAVTIVAAKNKVSLRDTMNQSAQVYGITAGGARTDNASSRQAERERAGRMGAQTLKSSPMPYQALPVPNAGSVMMSDTHLLIQQYSPQQNWTSIKNAADFNPAKTNGSDNKQAALGKQKISIKGYKRSFAHALGLNSLAEPQRTINGSQSPTERPVGKEQADRRPFDHQSSSIRNGSVAGIQVAPSIESSKDRRQQVRKKNSLAVTSDADQHTLEDILQEHIKTDRGVAGLKQNFQHRNNGSFNYGATYDSPTLVGHHDVSATASQIMNQTTDGFRYSKQNSAVEPLKIVNERSWECARTDGDASPVGKLEKSFENVLRDDAKNKLDVGRGTAVTIGGILARQSSLDEGVPAKFRNTSYLGLANKDSSGCDETVPSVIGGNMDKFAMFSQTMEKLKLQPKSRSRDYRSGAPTAMKYVIQPTRFDDGSTPGTGTGGSNVKDSEALMQMFLNMDRIRIKTLSSSRTHHFPGVVQQSVSDEDSMGTREDAARLSQKKFKELIQRVADQSLIASDSNDSLRVPRRTEPAITEEARDGQRRKRHANLDPDVQDLLKKINVINHQPIRVEGNSSNEHVGLSQSNQKQGGTIHARRHSRQTNSRDQKLVALNAQIRPQIHIEKLTLKSKEVKPPVQPNMAVEEQKNIYDTDKQHAGNKSSEKKKKKQTIPKEPLLQNQKQQKLLMAHQFAPQPIYLLSTQHAFSKNTMKAFNESVNAINQILQMTLRQKTASHTDSQPGLGHSAPPYFDWNRLQRLAKQCGFPNEFTKKTTQDALQFLRQKDFLTLLRVRMHGLLNSVIYQQFVFNGEAAPATSTVAASTPNTAFGDKKSQPTAMYANQKIERPRIYKSTAKKFANKNPFDARVPPNSHLMMLQQWQQSTGGQQNASSHLQNNSLITAALQECQAYYQTQQPANYKFYTCSTGNNHPVVRQILKRRTWLTRVDQIKSPAMFDQVQLFWTQWRQQKIVDRLSPFQLYAKIDGNECLSNKANLLATMVNYYKTQQQQVAPVNDKDDPPAIRDAFSILPVTYNITASKNLAEDREFTELHRRFSHQKAIWICKPGENANRGRGIVVLPNLGQVRQFLQSGGVRWGDKWVVQKYISHPLLIGGKHWNNTPMRKFDLRVFALAQIVDGIHFRGYFYKEGYARTSSYEYDTSDLADRDVHLTNDAVQAHTGDYNKYEQGNKVSFKDFATYLMNQKGVDFYKKVVPRIRQAIKHTLDAMWLKLQHQQKKTSPRGEAEAGPAAIVNQFELLGYDFMIDEDINVYLIEVNTNPCLDTSPCPLLQRLIPQVLDQTFKIAVDPFLPARDSQYASAQEMSMSEINYEMICSNQAEIQAISHKGGAKFPPQQSSTQPLIPVASQKKLEKLRGGNKINEKSPYGKSSSPPPKMVASHGLADGRRQSKIQKLVDAAQRRAALAADRGAAQSTVENSRADIGPCSAGGNEAWDDDEQHVDREPKQDEEEIDETCKRYLKEYLIQEVPKMTSFDDHGLDLKVPSKLL